MEISWRPSNRVTLDSNQFKDWGEWENFLKRCGVQSNKYGFNIGDRLIFSVEVDIKKIKTDDMS